jgi:hypothetical protein
MNTGKVGLQTINGILQTKKIRNGREEINKNI